MTRMVFFALLFVCAYFPMSAQKSAPDLIADADRLATVEFNNPAALKILQQAESQTPNSFDVLWRLSRVYVDLGEHLPAKTDQEKQKQLDMYMTALSYAEKAVQANPSVAEGYIRRAIANGRVALFKGVWESKDLVKKVKADTEKAISIDPNNPLAYYILARSHAKLAEKPWAFRWPLGLGWGNVEEAIRLYEKAISLRPTFIMYRLDAAKAYIDDDQNAKAKEHLEAIASLPKQDEDDDNYRQEAKQILQTLQ